MPFGGLKVLSLESRRAKEMEALVRREGGDPLVAPSVEERALDDQHEALDFVDRALAGEFDLVVCMTGISARCREGERPPRSAIAGAPVGVHRVPRTKTVADLA